jgi:hypothetical protein
VFLAIWISPLEKVLFGLVAHFFIGSLIIDHLHPYFYYFTFA